MRKIHLLFFVIVLFLCSCTYQSEFRPERTSENIWVCEKPYIDFEWSEEKTPPQGKFIYSNKEYNVVYKATYGALMIVFTNEVLQCYYVDEYTPYELFRGRVNYEKDCFTLTVEEDKQNIFGGEKPVMKFVKHDKEKYFNGKNIEVKNVEHRNK